MTVRVAYTTLPLRVMHRRRVNNKQNDDSGDDDDYDYDDGYSGDGGGGTLTRIQKYTSARTHTHGYVII